MDDLEQRARAFFGNRFLPSPPIEDIVVLVRREINAALERAAQKLDEQYPTKRAPGLHVRAFKDTP